MWISRSWFAVPKDKGISLNKQQHETNFLCWWNTSLNTCSLMIRYHEPTGSMHHHVLATDFYIYQHFLAKPSGFWRQLLQVFLSSISSQWFLCLWLHLIFGFECGRTVEALSPSSCDGQRKAEGRWKTTRCLLRLCSFPKGIVIWSLLLGCCRHAHNHIMQCSSHATKI